MRRQASQKEFGGNFLLIQPSTGFIHFCLSHWVVWEYLLTLILQHGVASWSRSTLQTEVWCSLRTPGYCFCLSLELPIIYLDTTDTVSLECYILPTMQFNACIFSALLNPEYSAYKETHNNSSLTDEKNWESKKSSNLLNVMQLIKNRGLSDSKDLVVVVDFFFSSRVLVWIVQLVNGKTLI